MAHDDMSEKGKLEVDVSAEIAKNPPSDAMPIEREESSKWKRLVYALVALTPFVGASAPASADEGNVKTTNVAKKTSEYSEAEKKEALDELLSFKDDESWEASMHFLLDKARKSRVAEQGALNEKIENVFPSDLGDFDWTEYGKEEVNGAFQTWIFKLRIVTKDGRTLQSKKFYELMVSKFAIHDKNILGIAGSCVLDESAKISTTAIDELDSNAGTKYKRGSITLNEFVNGVVTKVASKQ